MVKEYEIALPMSIRNRIYTRLLYLMSYASTYRGSMPPSGDRPEDDDVSLWGWKWVGQSGDAMVF